MVQNYFIVLSSLSICASLISLYILIIGSFEVKEKKEVSNREQFIKRESRIIKVNQSDNNQTQRNEGVNTQVSSLLWTVVIGQVIALYF